VAVAKHFPGLGGATANTDSGTAETLPISTLQADALPPFRADQLVSALYGVQ
jgi:beta-N-acetylhexosaminidase